MPIPAPRSMDPPRIIPKVISVVRLDEIGETYDKCTYEEKMIYNSYVHQSHFLQTGDIEPEPVNPVVYVQLDIRGNHLRYLWNMDHDTFPIIEKAERQVYKYFFRELDSDHSSDDGEFDDPVPHRAPDLSAIPRPQQARKTREQAEEVAQSVEPMTSPHRPKRDTVQVNRVPSTTSKSKKKSKRIARVQKK